MIGGVLHVWKMQISTQAYFEGSHLTSPLMWQYAVDTVRYCAPSHTVWRIIRAQCSVCDTTASEITSGTPFCHNKQRRLECGDGAQLCNAPRSDIVSVSVLSLCQAYYYSHASSHLLVTLWAFSRRHQAQQPQERIKELGYT